jgi:DNA-binding NarL/FixJ family response regulator
MRGDGPVDAAGKADLPPAPPAGRPYSVVVVDDVVLVCERIGELIAADDRLEPVGEAHDGREGLRMIRELRPDVVVLDVFMPEMNGAEVFAALKKDGPPETKILVLTGGPDARLYDMLMLRPHSMLYKTAVADETICSEIVALATGEEHSPGRDVLREATLLAEHRIELGEDELHLLDLLAGDLLVKDMSARLHVSTRVIEEKLRRLRAQLKVRNNWAAVAKAYDLGILPRRR